MAIAIAVSAAEMAMENRAKKYPSSSPGKRKRLNTAKLISVAFSISSTEMRIAKCVAAGEEPVYSRKHHDGRNHQVIFHVYHNSYLLRAINNPPTIHASSRMLTASKGNR